MNRAIAGDVALFILSIVMMFSYASLSIGEAHPVKSRKCRFGYHKHCISLLTFLFTMKGILLGIGGVFGIVLSILMGFGICSMFGVAFNPVTQVLPVRDCKKIRIEILISYLLDFLVYSHWNRPRRCKQTFSVERL